MSTNLLGVAGKTAKRGRKVAVAITAFFSGCLPLILGLLALVCVVSVIAYYASLLMQAYNGGIGGQLNTNKVPAAYVTYVKDAGQQCPELNSATVAAQIEQESGWRANPPDGGAGALGISQFIPATWKTWGNGGDPLNPKDAIAAQARYDCALAKQVEDMKAGKFLAGCDRPPGGTVTGDTVQLMLAAYNAGPCAVQAHGGIPPYKETTAYVRDITALEASYTIPGTAGGGSADSGQVAQVLALARQQVGKPYVWGGNGPNAFDCSGFVKWVFNQVTNGQAVPDPNRVVDDELTLGIAVSADNVQPGDVIAWDLKTTRHTYGTADPSSGEAGAYTHIAIYEGNGMIVEAANPRIGVVETKLANVQEYSNSVHPWAVRRLLKPVASGPTIDNGVYNTQTFVLPVHNYVLTAGFGASGGRWSHGHTGQDFAVPVGTPVSSVGAGTVVQAGWDGAYGNDIIIKTGDVYILYGHLSQIQVAVGASVNPGQQIALSGNTGNTTGPHLHFEVRTTQYYGSAIDPVAWLASKGVSVSTAVQQA